MAKFEKGNAGGPGRPKGWRRSQPYDDGSEDNYGWTIHEYDPLAEEDADYDD